uniref:J domain-containing protein n=1 Tax=Panagrellus redivivus TaxID=6233 RepID=A0A7E4V9G0_PANRE
MSNLYALLGCAPSSTTEQIQAEFRSRVVNMHPDKFDSPEDKARAEESFRDLYTAKDILCDPSKRKHYDMYLTMGSQMPLKEWMDNQNKLQQTLHWAAPTNSVQMIAPSHPEPNYVKPDGWKRHESPTISAFRNYRI